MQNFRLKSGAVAGFGFFDLREQPVHLHTNIELFYVLEGEVDFSVGEAVYRLGLNDFLLVNPGVGHSHTVSTDALYACLHLNYGELCARLGVARVLFNCNTAQGRGSSHAELHTLLKKIFNLYNADMAPAQSLYLEGLYFHLLNCLVASFLEENPAEGGAMVEELRVGEIQGYIENNYKAPISLEDLAEKLFLSPSYLSKYIKKHFGMNFSSYLGEIRLAHAVEELQTSKKSITRVALDNGFPNTASFNRVFKAKYGTTPSKRTEGMRPAARDTADTPEAAEKLNQKVQQYFENRAGAAAAEAVQARQAKLVRADAGARRRYTKSWNKMINIGLSSDLFNSDMREHLVLMKKELGFQYVRFWDFYSPILFLDIGPGQRNYNFTKLDRLFDFLLDNDMRPYIELGFKPILVLRAFENEVDFMVQEPREILFETPAAYEHFVFCLISHYASRYGQEEVEKWYFEQWIDPRQTTGGDYNPYFEMFEAAHRGLKSVVPGAQIGGGGLSVDNNLHIDYPALLKHWYARTCHPDYFSIYCYPYTIVQQGRKHASVYQQVGALRQAAISAGFDSPVFHVSEWNFTASDRNTLNDSCFKAAYIVKNVLESMQQVEVMGYWSASDLLSEFHDTNRILNGSGGLISRDGIKKPSYHAFGFLKRMGKHLLVNEENCAVTTNGHDEYTVVCHNYQRPNFKYFLKPEGEFDIHDLPNLYESDERLYMQIQVDNVKNGKYIIKTHSMSDTNGSVLNEWVRMGLVQDLNKQEIDYLKRVCVPRISIETCEVRDSVLLVDTVLQPQEIQCIHLIYRMEV